MSLSDRGISGRAELGDAETPGGSPAQLGDA